jgi:hypothetical protein
MLFRNKIILIIATLLLILGVGLYVSTQNIGDGGEGGLPFSLGGIFDRNGQEAAVGEAHSDPTGDTVTASGNVQLPITYQNKQFGFELDLPEGYTGSSFTEGFGVTALLQNPETGESFQIYIAEFDEEGPLTVERIQQDLPDLVITEPQVALIAGGRQEALIFIGESEDFGKTREVWFVHGEQLYQVIAPFEMEQSIGPIMESLRFQ